MLSSRGVPKLRLLPDGLVLELVVVPWAEVEVVVPEIKLALPKNEFKLLMSKGWLFVPNEFWLTTLVLD